MILEPTRLLQTIMEHEHAPLSLADNDHITVPYKDSLGTWTIGFGTTRLNGASVTEQTKPITRREAVQLMLADLYQAQIDTQEFMPNKCNSRSSTRTEVIIEMAYQLGLTKLNKFINVRNCIYGYRWVEAAEQMWDSKWATQTPARAKILATRFYTGQYNASPYEDILFVNQVYGNDPDTDPHA